MEVYIKILSAIYMERGSMHIQVQCCGIALMVVLLIFYLRQRRVSLKTERAFLRAFCVTMACIVFDILSIIVIAHKDELPSFLVELICKSYLVTLLGVAMGALSYVCVDVYVTKERYKKAVVKYEFSAIVGTLAIYILPIHYQFGEDGQTVLYSYGPSVLATYVFALALLVVTFYLMWKEKGKINPRRREAVRLWMGIWIGASLIQFFNNELLIVGYACSIGMVVLYLKLENPEMNLDRQTGLFNHGALVQYTKEFYKKEEGFSLLAIIFERSFHKNMRADTKGTAKMEMVEFLLKIPDAFVFKNTEDEVLLLFKNQDTAEEKMSQIFKRFEEGWGAEHDIYVRPYWLYMPDSKVVDNAEDMLYLMRYIRQNNNEFSENRFIYVDEKRASEMYQEKQTAQLLLDAMEKDWVEVYYQPIYSTKEQRFVSAEALVRIKDENGKIVPPGAFIDVAEKNGMILRLGEVVFEKVCRFVKENAVEQYGLQYIEVNLSVVQCAYEQLAEDYIRIMEKYGVDPDFINLEITESASMSAKKTLLNNMKNLIKYGISFSLDDFGTGQSNLNYIVDMPVDIVKFDRDMINAYFENGKAKYVMDAAMHMVHGMDLEIVSEGIETKEQYQTMEELGISYIQGYYFSKPLSERQFLEFIAASYKEAAN